MLQDIRTLAGLFGPNEENGMLIKLEDDQPALYIRAAIDLNSFRRAPIEYGEIELYRYDPEGPLLHFKFVIHDKPQNPLKLDTFMNPELPNHRDVLKNMVTYFTLVIILHSTLNDTVAAKAVPWKPEYQTAIASVLNSIPSRENSDNAAAKARWFQDHPE